MPTRFLFFSLILIAVISCNQPTDFQKKLNCSPTNSKNDELVYDFNKNFSLKIPSNWKTNLYYDNFKSEIFAADTVKPLSESFILGASIIQSNLSFNDEFFKNANQNFQKNELLLVSSGSFEIKNKQGYFFKAKGEKNNFNYQLVTVVILVSGNSYFSGTVEVYGNAEVDKRICNGVSILNSLEIIEQ